MFRRILSSTRALQLPASTAAHNTTMRHASVNVLDEMTPSVDAEDDAFFGSTHEPMGTVEEVVLQAIDMLCDDLYTCKSEVLRAFARSRNVPTSTHRATLVTNIIEAAHAEGQSNSDLRNTKRVLGDVFKDDVRVTGPRSQWTNQSLEASSIENACERHSSMSRLGGHSKALHVRLHQNAAARFLRQLSRPLQDDYDSISATATGGVFRVYKEEADSLVENLPPSEILAPFSAYLVAALRSNEFHMQSSQVEVVTKIAQSQLVRPTVEDGDMTFLESLMKMHDTVSNEVDLRQECYNSVFSKRTWGQDIPEVLLKSTSHFVDSNRFWELDDVPSWVTELSQKFSNWESIVRHDLPELSDVPPIVFHQLLQGVACFKIIQIVYGDDATAKDVPKSYATAVLLALKEHFHDDDKAAKAVEQLQGYVQIESSEKSKKVVRTVQSQLFASILSQMQSAAKLPTGDGSSSMVNERIGLVLREAAHTASLCDKTYGLFPLLVRITEDLKFHLRFGTVFKRLSSRDREIIRTRKGINMHETLAYFEKELHITPLSTKATSFLTIILFFMCARGSAESGKALLERYASVTGKEEFSIISISDAKKLTARDIRVALPPQLSYKSWLTVGEKESPSVYNTLHSTAVKGTSNQAMLLSQTPMMRALDAISRVPLRISKYMLHVQEAIVREGFGFGKIRPGFYPLHYCNFRSGEIRHPQRDTPLFNMKERERYFQQQQEDWRNLQDLRSSRVHYLQALRQARAVVQFSHIYFPHSMDFRGRMYPLPGRLNHTGSDPFRALLEYADPKPLGTVGVYWLKVHLANKMGMNKLTFDERAQFVDEHIDDVVRSAESPLSGDKWWQEGAEPLQALMACKELADALKCSQGPESFLSRIAVAVDGSYNGLQHYSAIGRDEFGGQLVNLVPSERPADAYTGILKVMMKTIEKDAVEFNEVAQRCIGSGIGLDKNHIKRKTIKRPIMTQVYGVTAYGMTEQIMDELVIQNKAHGLWTATDMREMAHYVRDKLLESLGELFKETQQCRKWLEQVTETIWRAQPSELRSAFCWTTPLGLIVRQPYRIKKEANLFTSSGFTKTQADSSSQASRKQLSAIAPNLIHSLDATHLAMTALEMQNRGLSMIAVHDSYWTYACDLPDLSTVLREQFVSLYSNYDPLVELKEQWEEAFFLDLRRHGLRLPDPPKRGNLDLKSVLKSEYFFS